MFKPSVNLKSVERIKGLPASLKELKSVRVFVGVPEEDTQRKLGDAKHPHNQDVTSAQLVYIHTHGSPLKGIPARPIIELAIEADKANIVAELKDAGVASLAGKKQEAMLYFRRAGQEAENFVRGWFFDARNNWAPNKPATIARKGSDRPLIDTGELRKSIVFVIGRNK
jgi:hypothetical protein